MLYGRRKRLAEMAEREAAGESLWTDEFDEQARRKIVLIAQKAVGQNYGSGAFYEVARDAVLMDEGRFFLCEKYMHAEEDLLNHVLRADDEGVVDAVEALSGALHTQRLQGAASNYAGGEYFDLMVATVLREHRISYDLIAQEMVPIKSLAMHANVIEPSLRLLAGRPDLAGVETAYQNALDELAKGKAGDAITDAGTALQEMLTTLGCEGNALGPLIKSAKSKGLLAGHDAPMVEMIEKAAHWVSADRSEKGDAHSSVEPALDDAWFTVNVVGALLLRLSKGARSA